MKHKTKYFVFLMLLVTLSIITIVKSQKNKNIKLDNVSLKEEISNMNGLAIMLQQEDGTYKESINKSFPNDMTFNESLSGCIDNLGNKIEKSLTYENGVANVETSSTSYCYLYFDEKLNVGELLTFSKNDIWDSTLEDDGYRYVGTNPNNYICFGTMSQNDCTSDTDKYMYRIIGIFEDSSGEQHLKLIKKEALNTTYAWHSDHTIDVDWNESDLYNGINGSYFLTNSEYLYMQNSTWLNKIETWNYTATNTRSYENYDENSIYGPHYRYQSVQSIYLHELNRGSKSNQECYYSSSSGATTGIADCSTGEWKIVASKIGLMYVSDYLLSLGEQALNYIPDNNGDLLKQGWLHIINNDIKNTEWTMTRYGEGTSNFFAYGIVIAGYVSNTLDTLERLIRPVFYLTSDITISGKGTIDNPFVVNL